MNSSSSRGTFIPESTYRAPPDPSADLRALSSEAEASRTPAAHGQPTASAWRAVGGRQGMLAAIRICPLWPQGTPWLAEAVDGVGTLQHRQRHIADGSAARSGAALGTRVRVAVDAEVVPRCRGLGHSCRRIPGSLSAACRRPGFHPSSAVCDLSQRREGRPGSRRDGCPARGRYATPCSGHSSLIWISLGGNGG